MQYQYNERSLVYQRDKVKLYHYAAKVRKLSSIPLLLVFATVNRPEILDLFPDHSFIGGLLKEGQDVYLLDWGYPDKDDQTISISHYVSDYLYHCVTFITKETQENQINLLGICQGGIICLCYALIFKNIRNLILISVPIDFATKDNVVGQMLKRINVEELIALTGNVPGPWLTQFFISLRPFELIGKKYLHFVDKLSDEAATEKFLQVEKWLYDAPDQTGESFKELVKDLYHDNKLIKGEFRINGKKMNLRELRIPVLNIMAAEDEIVPVSASSALKEYIEPKYYAECQFQSGHIGIYISDKVGSSMPRAIVKWLAACEMTS